MFKLKNVRITGFWNEHWIENEFFDDVNIFIGVNGTGKTSFISIIQAVLTVNIDVLDKYQFSTVELELFYENDKCHISVINSEDDDMFVYKVDNDIFNIPKRRIRAVGTYVDDEFIKDDFTSSEQVEALNRISRMVNIILLSVNRQIYLDKFNNRYRHMSQRQFNTVDQKLNNLIGQFMDYKFELELKVKALSNQFEKDVVKSLLYNEEVDKVNYKEFKDSKHDFISEKEGLYKAFGNLNALDDDAIKKIDSHIDAMKKSYEHLVNNKMEIEDLIPITLLARTEHIIKLTTKMEEKKNQYYKHLNEFELVLGDFIKNKEIKYSSNKFIIFKNNRPLMPEQLSSGEKQLLILLIESLLQYNKPCIFIADEPEISLHIDWQEKILPSITKLNRNAQIIVATHSPEIASNYPERIVNMEDILHGKSN